MSSPEPLRAQISAASRAVEYARRASNSDDGKIELLVDQIHTLSELRVRDGDFPRAESLLREAMFRIEEARHPRPLMAANVASSLGFLYDRWGNLDKASEWYEKSLAIAESGGFFFSDLGASVSNNLGMLRKKAGNLIEAEEHYTKALHMFSELKSNDSAEVAAVCNNLGVLHYTRGDNARAKDLHQRALGIRQGLHQTETNDGWADLCQSHRNLAAVFRTMGEPEKSADLLNQAGLKEEPEDAPTPNWSANTQIKSATTRPTFVASQETPMAPPTPVFTVEIHTR